MSPMLDQAMREAVLPALQPIGFFPEGAISSDSWAVLLCKPSNRVCCYLILREQRGGTVFAELRVAPPEFPDDRLRQLPGYCLELGQCHDYASEHEKFLRSIVHRAGILIPRIGGVIEAVEEELMSPSFLPDFVRAYARVSVGYEVLCRQVPPKNSAAFDRVIEVARHVARGEQAADHLAAACVPLVKELKPVIEAFRDAAFDGKSRTVARLIAPHFYVNAVTGRLPQAT